MTNLYDLMFLILGCKNKSLRLGSVTLSVPQRRTCVCVCEHVSTVLFALTNIYSFCSDQRNICYIAYSIKALFH